MTTTGEKYNADSEFSDLAITYLLSNSPSLVNFQARESSM